MWSSLWQNILQFQCCKCKMRLFWSVFKQCVAIEVASLALLITSSFFCLWYLILKGFSKLTHFVWRLRFFAFLLIFRSIVLNMIKHLWKMSKCSLLSFNWRKRWLNGKKKWDFLALQRTKKVIVIGASGHVICKPNGCTKD